MNINDIHKELANNLHLLNYYKGRRKEYIDKKHNYPTYLIDDYNYCCTHHLELCKNLVFMFVLYLTLSVVQA